MVEAETLGCACNNETPSNVLGIVQLFKVIHTVAVNT